MTGATKPSRSTLAMRCTARRAVPSSSALTKGPVPAWRGPAESPLGWIKLVFCQRMAFCWISAAALSQQFDLVVLVHALEHLVDPVAFLTSIRPLMLPGAQLLIQVPDLLRSPFDLLIADHCTHFTSKTLVDVVTRAGFVVERLADHCVDKELTLLCRVPSESKDAGPPSSSECGLTAAQAHLAWLGDLAKQGQGLSGRVAVFGSSIAATWLASLLGDRLQCFVDEDPGRVGRSHLGRTILRPDQTPLNLPVLVPLRPELARSVTARLSATGLGFVAPPVAR